MNAATTAANAATQVMNVATTAAAAIVAAFYGKEAISSKK